MSVETMHSSVGSQVRCCDRNMDLIHPNLLQFSMQYAHIFTPIPISEKKKKNEPTLVVFESP